MVQKEDIILGLIDRLLLLSHLSFHKEKILDIIRIRLNNEYDNVTSKPLKLGQ